MKNYIAKNKILIPLFMFFLISMFSIYSATVNFASKDIIFKQLAWYLIGFVIILATTKLKCKKILDYAGLLYVLGNVLLFLLLLFGIEVNGSKCWFIIPGLGSIQPSEFMKLILILMITKVFISENKKHERRTLKNDVRIFAIVMILTLIPSFLTFLQPDTGMVIIYFLIAFIMLFVYGIKKSIFIVIIVGAGILMAGFLVFYFNYQDNFIDVFGTSFFYRMDRLLDWSNKSGMQLTNALTAIKAAGLFGFGLGNTPIYIPEAHTDFIFSIYANNTGFVGTLILIVGIFLFDAYLFRLADESNDKGLKYIIAGFGAMIVYQQLQNIGMNVGILPITGITLPFISYGGSSLLSYMLGISLILNYNGNEHYKNA